MEKRVKKFLLFIVKLLVSATALYLVIKKAGLESLGVYLRNLNPYYFFLASFLYFLSIYISSIRWRVLLWDVDEIGVNYLFGLYITGSFFSTILPGLIGGDALRIYYLHRLGVNLSEAAGSTFLDRYTGYIGLIITAIFGGLLADVKWQVMAALLGLVVLLVFGSWTLLRFRFGRRLLRLENFYNYFADFFTRPGVVFFSVLCSVVVQALVVLSVYSVMKAMAVELSIWALFAYMTLIITVATVPVSISGLGIREWAFVVLFGLSGIKVEAATAVSLLWYLSYVIGAMPGAIGYLLLRDRQGDVP